MISKILRNIKKKLKPSVSKQIIKDLPKGPFVENIYLKEARKPIVNVSESKSKYFVITDKRKVEEYLQKRNIKENKVSYIHTHFYDPKKEDFPSLLDFITGFIKRKNYQHIFVIDKKRAVGKISYSFTRNNSLLQREIITELNKIKRDLNLELRRASEILPFEKYKSFKKDQVSFFYIGLNTLIAEKILIWKKKNSDKPTIDFFKELGFNIKVIPNKNYKYDYKELKFIKK